MQDHPEKDRTDTTSPAISTGKRILYLCLGFLMLGFGIIIFAAWFFARSSPKFEARLLADQRFGPLVIKWRERGAIPPRAKLYACIGMTVGYGLFWWGAKPGWLLAAAVTVFMLGSAAYVLSRPSD